MRIAICDDVDYIRNEIREFCKGYIFDEIGMDECEIKGFNSGDELLEDLQYNPDIIFLDIEMPGINGLQTAEILRKRNKKTMIIYITSHIEAMKEAFGINVISFLEKPVIYEDVKKVLYSILQYYENENYFQVDKNQKVRIKDIYYIKADSGYTDVYATNDKKYISRKRFAEYEGQLEQNNIIRINKSVMVNLEYVTKYNQLMGTISVAGNDFKISRRRMKDFKEKYTSCMMDKF